jgi:glycosyltransferase involved in cell wall biosynthesis
LDVFKKEISKDINISIIITNFNYGHYLDRCISSVIKNTHKKIEIVIVDDCSSDNSLNILKEYLYYPINITIISKKINTGLSHSRNLGIEYSNSEYIFMLDADNYIYEDCLEEHLKLIEKEKADVVYGIIDCYTNNVKVSEISNESYNLSKLKNGNYIDSMALYRKSTLLKIGGYDYEMMNYGFGWEDYELWIKLGLNECKIVNINRSLSYYDKREDSMISLTGCLKIELQDYIKKKYFNNANIQ